MIETRGLSCRFGGVYALDDVHLRVEPGELRGIIGPNGAGKSTLFHLIAGHLRAHAGGVLMAGEPIDHLRPDQRARRGIGIVYQSARIFRGMTVTENVMVGAHSRTRHGFLQAAFRTPASRREDREVRALANALLERVGLRDLGEAPAETLPLGQQRSMQLARALAGSPKVLLLDEPASGLRAGERSHLANLIKDLRKEGLTVLLVEHDVALVTSLSDSVTVLNLGKVISEGAPAMVQKDPAVVSAYLGAEAEA